MQRILLLTGIIGFILLYMLTISTDTDSIWSHYFWGIVLACTALGIVLLLTIIRFGWQIIQDRRKGVFGSQIARRLSLAFTLVAVLPALFLFAVSAQFISVSINSWFGNDTREALERSLNLSKSALNLALEHSISRANSIQGKVQQAIEKKQLHLFFHTEEAKQFSYLAIWDEQNQTLIAEYNPFHLPPPNWDETTSVQLSEQDRKSSVERIENILYSQAWLRLPSAHKQPSYLLFFRQPIPKNVAEDAELIELAWSKYAELTFAKEGLRTFFLITLLVAALLAILIALVIALNFARRFVEPILSLATGARTVAQGDFSQKIAVHQKDELGRLTQLFNDMTEQLASAKIADSLHRAELEAARHYLERVLDSLSAGVITLNADNSVRTFNCAAERILAQPLQDLVGYQPEQWQTQSPQHQNLAELFHHLLATESSATAIQTSYIAPDENRILFGKAIRLPEENDCGCVLVFDDITALVQAQKEAAWGEVAKRLAHEIRNPLTPIQLSAERLAWKLEGKLGEAEAQIVNKSTDTIIKQVAALKEMVEVFRDYARATVLSVQKLNLNQLIEEILVLYETNPCEFHTQLTTEATWVNANMTAMRQVLHNVLKNAAEAAETAEEGGKIWVQTRIQAQNIILTIENNGLSFSRTMLSQAFEPYITDKVGGTGLGLPVVKKIIEEHNGTITLSNRNTSGACVSITLPIADK